ncbi:hypothetical protein ACHAXS_010934 [Conticribra weissflogii]
MNQQLARIGDECKNISMEESTSKRLDVPVKHSCDPFQFLEFFARTDYLRVLTSENSMIVIRSLVRKDAEEHENRYQQFRTLQKSILGYAASLPSDAALFPR